MSDLVTIAIGIARVAHAGQVDKQGRPYEEHCARVANRMTDEDDEVVAWLHDVIEDTEWTCDDLLGEGIPLDLVEAVAAITRGATEFPTDYYRRVLANPTAHRVKLADIADNLDPRRLLALPAETMVRLMRKYAKALDALQGTSSLGYGDKP